MAADSLTSPHQRPETSGLAARMDVTDGSAPWQPPTPWMAFFLGLGEEIAAEHCAGKRVAAIAIPPARPFAAAFAATGAVVAVAQAVSPLPELDEHFLALSALPPQTRVVVVMGPKTYAGEFVGIVQRPEGTMVRVRYDGMTHYIPKEGCHKIQVGSGGKKTLPTVYRGRGRPNRETGVVRRLLGDGVARQFLAVPTVDVVLVGQLATLAEELSTVQVRPLPDGGRTEPIRLASLLRPTRLLADGGISRSMLISDRSTEFEPPVADVPHVAVFDGARAFSRYRSEFPDSSWIVILDRCSPRLREGVDVANGEYATRRANFSALAGLDVPAGTEIQAFERR